MSFTPATVLWYVDGTAKGNATGSLTTWNITWNLGSVTAGATTPNAGEVLDGTYLCPPRASTPTVRPARRSTRRSRSTAAPRTRRATRSAGRNGGNGYIEWGANAERDVEGYRVFRVGSAHRPGRLRSRHGRDALQGERHAVRRAAVLRAARSTATPSGNQRLGDPSALVTRPGDRHVAERRRRRSWPPSPAATPCCRGRRRAIRTPATRSQFYRIYRDGTDFIDGRLRPHRRPARTSPTPTPTPAATSTRTTSSRSTAATRVGPIGSGVTK